MTTREQYDAAVAKLRRAGTVTESDWPRVEGQPPYRLAHLELKLRPADAISQARDLAELTIVCGAHMTLGDYRGTVTIGIHVSRPLTAEEIAAALPRAERGMAEVSP